MPRTRADQRRTAVPSPVVPLVLEIGTEELPSSFLPIALSDLSNLGKRTFEANRLPYKTLRTVGTPRRLVLLVEGVQGRQTSLTHEILGPPKAAAYDASGQPTKAALGFAGSQGVKVEDLLLKETAKGWYVGVQKCDRGQSAKQVLSKVLPELLGSLAFQKSMRWNASRVRFARPIRWLLALLGDQLLPLEFAGIHSSASTRGHRFFGQGKSKGQHLISVPQASKYLEIVRKVGVRVDPKDRRTLIQQQVRKLVRKVGGKLDPDHEEALVADAVYGVESPKAILGTFPEEYLSLPKPVLISSMKEHQGFFAVLDDAGKLLPNFIAVTNMPWGNSRTITKGNERVLAARLHDAQYFFREDTKCPLWEKVGALEGVVFHQKLGTVYQKVLRLQDQMGWLTDHLGLVDLKPLGERAGLLSKSDLVTGMVGEFPTLQGVMGEEYARYDGEPEEVAEALGEQYLPRFPEDRIPESAVGTLLAAVDRCDSITAFFAGGMAPSGSEDPLGLRRAAYGLVRIVAETPLRLNLVGVVEHALDLLEKQGMVQGSEGTVSTVVGFILERLRYYAGQTMGFQDDVMEAVISVRSKESCEVLDLLSRMGALQSMLKEPDFETLMIGFKRAHRIVEKEQWEAVSVSPDRFREPQERRLFEDLGHTSQSMREAIQAQSYGRALHALLQLKSPIDDFFVKVMVNDANPDIRANRLSLLQSVDQLFLSYADFSCIPTGGG